MTRCWTGWLVSLAVGLPALLLPSAIGRLLGHVSQGRHGATAVACGLAVGAVSWIFLARCHAGFWRTLHHEMSHAGMAMLVGGRPTTLAVRRETGSVEYSLTGPFRGVRSLLVTLAPYSISPLALLVASLFAVATPKRASEFCLAGAVVGIALMAPLMEIDPRQEDLRKSGGLVAIGCSVWLWAAMTTLLLQVLTGADTGTAIGRNYVQASRTAIRMVSLAGSELTLR